MKMIKNALAITALSILVLSGCSNSDQNNSTNNASSAAKDKDLKDMLDPNAENPKSTDDNSELDPPIVGEKDRPFLDEPSIPEAPSDSAGEATDARLAKLNPTAFNDLLNVLSKPSDDDLVEDEDINSTDIRINDNGKRDVKGRYTIVAYNQAPLFCYTDLKNKVSFQVQAESALIVNLAPVTNCDYDFNKALQIEVGSGENDNLQSVLPLELDESLKPLFEEFTKTLRNSNTAAQ